MELGERGLSPEHVDPSGEQQSAPNINDVLQAIEAADPSFRDRGVEVGVAAPVAPGAMFGGSVQAGAGGGAPPPLQPHDMYINIVEQPASKALRTLKNENRVAGESLNYALLTSLSPRLRSRYARSYTSSLRRFRYECEGRSAGSIPGARSTAENKTYPTIEIVGYRGRAVVVVSCVTKDKPYKPHPHNLVGKDMCRDGVCTMQVNTDSMSATFSNLGIQCVKKRDIEDALRTRETIRVDPFKTGFSHKSQPSGIDLNAVRLCFQVFLEQDGKFKVALPPVVSDVIYDKKAMSELTICRMSHCAATVAGGQDVILLCEKVAKEDISVNLFELSEDGASVVWSATGENVLVHKQVAIAFRTPRYPHMQVDRSIHAFIQLKRPSDGATSDPRPFELTPVHSDNLSRKRMKLLQFSPQEFPNMEDMPSRFDMPTGPRDQKPIKVEPREMPQQYGHTSPVPNMGSNLNVYRNVALTPSPQYQQSTPSPPLHLHNYQYAPAPLASAYSPQPWNIGPDAQGGGGGGLQPLPSVSSMVWSAAEGGAGGAEGEASAAAGGNLFPTSDVSLSNLLHMGSLRELDSSDLAAISSSFLQPDPDVADSFSRLRTGNDPLSFHDKNLL